MNLLLAAAIGLMAGTHTATWGMYKDAPHEGFSRWKYARSILLATVIAVVVAAKSQRRAGWRDDPAVAGGGALFEGGVHWIDLLANVGLEVESARGFRPGQGTGLERSMLLVVKYKEGGVGTLAHSWEVPSPLHGLRVSRIYGTRGSAAFESNGIVVLVSGPRRRLVFPGLRDINGNRAMWADFLDVIRTGREPVMTAVRARRGLELVETAYRTAVDTNEAIR